MIIQMHILYSHSQTCAINICVPFNSRENTALSYHSFMRALLECYIEINSLYCKVLSYRKCNIITPVDESYLVV